MKNKETKNDIDAVKLMRDIRDKMSKDIAGMSYTELQAYFKKRRQVYSDKQKKETA